MAPAAAGLRARALSTNEWNSGWLFFSYRPRLSCSTIFSPEDGTPFPHLPPSMRKGRNRVWSQAVSSHSCRCLLSVPVFRAWYHSQS